MEKKNTRLSLSFEKRSDLARLTALTLLVVILMASLGWQQFVAEAAPAAIRLTAPAFSAPRLFYLTKTYYNGAQPDGSDGNGGDVCASGYHFASAWELADTSNLKYNTALGIMQGDSGLGPPSFYRGWARLGGDQVSYNYPASNCALWSQNYASSYGSSMYLPINLSAGVVPNPPWWVEAYACNNALPVWCVADHVGHRIYLPLVVK